MEEVSVIHVYCVPGLAANPTIFEMINLPESRFRIHWLDWLLPKKKESLQDYAKRMNDRIRHENPVLIGVSFGGVIVQEMSKMIKAQRVIIISSVKSEKELPRRMRFARCSGLFKVLPTSLAGHIDAFERIVIGEFAKKRIQLYKKYMSITDTLYLDWAIEKMVCWDQEEPLSGVIHIHGDKDIVFPYKYINGCITVPGGTHIMIVNRFRWFNENLEEIILTGKLNKGEKTELDHKEKIR